MKSSGFWNSFSGVIIDGGVVIIGGLPSSCGFIVAVPAEIVVTNGVASMTNDFTNAVADTCNGPLSTNRFVS